MNRREVLLGAVAGAAASAAPVGRAWAQESVAAARARGAAPQKIALVELIELTGHYDVEAGVNGQWQVNPLDIYDDERRPEYKDKPGGTKEAKYSAIYLRIKTADGLEGVYGPIEREPAFVVYDDLRP